jgi:hypothetical protein
LYGYSTPTWKEKEHPPRAQQGGNVADPAPRRSPRIEAQERVGGAAVVAFAQGGGAAVGGQVGGQGGGHAAGHGLAAKVLRLLPPVGVAILL